MLSTLEVVAKDARNLRIGTHVSSRSTRNLKANGILSMILVNDGAVYYIKGDALLLDAAISVAPQMARFNVRVDSVLQDSPAEYEDAVIVSGIQVRRENLHEPAAREILEELVR